MKRIICLGNILRSNNYSTHFDTLLENLHAPHSHVKAFIYLIMRSLLVPLSGKHQIDAARWVLDLPGSTI